MRAWLWMPCVKRLKRFERLSDLCYRITVFKPFVGDTVKASSCKVCGKQFAPRKNKIFCSPRCRYTYWIERPKDESPLCCYCGEVADTIDHIPPSVLRPFISDDPVLSKKYPFLEVNACKECNSILGARPFWTVESRKQFIKKALKKRYRKYARVKKWSDCELSEMDYSLKTYVISAMMQKERLTNRINW